MNHDILCDKLNYYGFRGKSQLLIRSYLSNRQQFVSINGFESSKLSIKCGVPQGSTLGPLLFLLYINDLRFSITSSIISHFADDTCITLASKKLKSLETVLNYDLKLCSEWLKANRLSLNADKSKLLLFQSKKKPIDYSKISIKLNGTKLIPADQVKYLGIFVDKHLGWDYQINHLSNKLSRANGVLYKLRSFCSRDTLLSVYYSLFYSHLIYGCPVWSLTTKANLYTINVLQKKSIRIINFSGYNCHTNDLFISNDLLKFDDIIKIERLKIVFDYIHQNLPTDLNNLFDLNVNINSHKTRNVASDGLFIPLIRTVSFGSKSLRYSAAVQWNNLIKGNKKIITITKAGLFKKKLKKYYISLYSKE